jgi:magnesium transporter
MNVLYSVSESKLDYVESKLREIEDQIFKGKEKQMVVEIAGIAKKLISFRQTIKSHDEVLRDAKPLFDRHFKDGLDDAFQATHTHYFYILRRMGSLVETLDALRETNMALLTTKQNEIMKTLTIMAFVTFPLSLFTSMFGMNTESTPILGSENDFWIIITVMAVAAVCFFAFFKYKHWI